MNSEQTVIKKLMADALQNMLSAKRIRIADHGKESVAADGTKLVYKMEGWGDTTWKQSEDGVIYKRCRGCYKWFPLSEFPPADGKKRGNPSKDGRASYCNSCKAKRRIADARAGKEFKVKLDNNAAFTKRIADYSDAELLRELRQRGYKGELTFTKIITV